MKKGHAGLWGGIAVFFVAVVYSVLLFLVKPHFDIADWVLYGATMVAFLLVGIQMMASSGSGSTTVMNSTFGIITAIYFGLQFIFGGIVFMCFTGLPLIPVIVCEIVFLAAYLVISFMMFGVQSGIAAQDQKDQSSIQKMRLLESDVQCMMEESANPEIKKALQDLAEAIHYSDVVSLPGLTELESRIAQNVALLRNELKDDETNPLAFTRIEYILRLLKERDRTAAILKK